VIFPEGRNFTPNRRTHSIAKLEELGDHHAAEDARELRHVLTPRPGGTLAALERAPDADVVFVAHAGLEDLAGVVDLWRGMPMDAAVQAKAWRVPAQQIPAAREARARGSRGGGDASTPGWWSGSVRRPSPTRWPPSSRTSRPPTTSTRRTELIAPGRTRARAGTVGQRRQEPRCA
jgi:hypothetical protein